MSLALLLLLCAWCTLVNSKGHGKISLNGTEIHKSFFLDSLVVHEGQFECLPPTVKGNRLLLRFDVILNNLSNDSAIFYPYTKPLQLHYQLYDNAYANVSRSGYFNISCIRDTFCYGLDEGNSNEMTPFFYACVHSGISAGCQQSVYGTGDCRWIDITGLDLFHLYRVTLSLVNPAEPGESRGTVDSTPWTTLISLKRIQRHSDPSVLHVVSSIILFGGTPAVALIFSKCYSREYQKEHTRRTSGKKTR